LDNKCFQRYNKSTKVFDKILNAWASYVDGTPEDAASMILFSMAKKFPQQYAKNFELATEKTEKIVGPPPPELPPDFVSYDGTNDIRWNTHYAKLIQYKEEHGDCKVPNAKTTQLGKWVTHQRSNRKTKTKSMTEKRIQLLDDLGFLWSGLRVGVTLPPPGGDPKLNRTVAAKLVYPELTPRECMYLGGFGDEELDVTKDQKHTWRTGYVVLKDHLRRKVDAYDNARRTQARLNIERLATTLRGEDEDKLTAVFGDTATLLPGFLETAEERTRKGMDPDKMANSTRKRNAKGVEDGDEENTERKTPRLDELEEYYGQPDPPSL